MSEASSNSQIAAKRVFNNSPRCKKSADVFKGLWVSPIREAALERSESAIQRFLKKLRLNAVKAPS